MISVPTASDELWGHILSYQQSLHSRSRTEQMARRTNPHTWKALKESGQLQERHVLMAIDLGMSPASIIQEHATSEDRSNLLLLEWLEDRFFAKQSPTNAPNTSSSARSRAAEPIALSGSCHGSNSNRSA